MSSPLLMIPGPIELAPAVQQAAAQPPRSHTDPVLIEAFGRSLRQMRQVWKASRDSQPFVVAGSGTLAMEMAVCNTLQPGDRAVLVNTGYFSDRLDQMLQRRNVQVTSVRARPGQSPPLDAVREALPGARALLATHVDTSTGVRIDVEGLGALAREAGALFLLDGVCATAAEPCEMDGWGLDVVLTASQKAIGAPPGLALLMASPRAIDARDTLQTPPPLSVDFQAWQPIMRAYEEGRPSYFATPATSLIMALDEALGQLTEIEAVWARHEAVARALRQAWEVMGLQSLPAPGTEANTLSALRYPKGVDAELVRHIGARGIAVAGGLHPELRATYFRVGHMGYTTQRPDWLRRTVQAVGEALHEAGHPNDTEAALRALEALG